MSNKSKKEDLRIRKTHKALIDALSHLLKSQNFNQITVNDLCENAMVSRSTFYSHFYDKYDFLSYWLKNMKPFIINDRSKYETIEISINRFMLDNKKILSNLVEDASNETTKLLCEYLLLLLDIPVGKADNSQTNAKHIILTELFSGGMLKYLSWQIEHKFPDDLPFMNAHLYDAVEQLIRWYRADL